MLSSLQLCKSSAIKPFAACKVPLRPRISGQQRLLCRADKTNGKPKDKQEEYVEALKKGGVDQQTAKSILETWNQTGAQNDPNQLRKLFLKQSLVPITASLVQLLFDFGAAYSIFISSTFFALGPPFWGRVALVYLLDFLAIYFAIGIFFDVVTLTSILITTVKLGTAPMAFYDAVKAIAGPAGGPAEGLKLVEKAKAAVSAVRVAQALDAIAALLDKAADGKSLPPIPTSDGGKAAATKSIDTLTNLSAYLTLYRAEKSAGFDPSSVGMSEAEAANIALVFGQYDLDDNGRLDTAEFKKMLQALGAGVSDDEAEAAMEVMDTDKDKYISFEEFAKWWGAKKAKALA